MAIFKRSGSSKDDQEQVAEKSDAVDKSPSTEIESDETSATGTTASELEANSIPGLDHLPEPPDFSPEDDSELESVEAALPIEPVSLAVPVAPKVEDPRRKVMILGASANGSPGVTTSILALAASWPSDRECLLVEADPFGGDLASRYQGTYTTGLTSLFAEARAEIAPERVWNHVQHLPGGLPVLFGVKNIDQSSFSEQAWPRVAAALSQLECDVIVDAGRFLPQLGAGVSSLLGFSDYVLVFTEPTIEGIIHIKDILPRVIDKAPDPDRVIVVPTSAEAPRTFKDTEIIGATKARRIGIRLPNDHKGADILANRAQSKSLGKLPVMKWAVQFLRDIDIVPADGNLKSVERGYGLVVGGRESMSYDLSGRSSLDIEPIDSTTSSTDERTYIDW